MQRNYESYNKSRGSIQKIIQPNDFTSNIAAITHQATFITISTIVLFSFPQYSVKEALIHVMSNYDPPVTQHNDHKQMTGCYSSSPLKGSGQTTVSNGFIKVALKIITIESDS